MCVCVCVHWRYGGALSLSLWKVTSPITGIGVGQICGHLCGCMCLCVCVWECVFAYVCATVIM